MRVCSVSIITLPVWFVKLLYRVGLPLLISHSGMCAADVDLPKQVQEAAGVQRGLDR